MLQVNLDVQVMVQVWQLADTAANYNYYVHFLLNTKYFGPFM
jgi:hypothetical protein